MAAPLADGQVHAILVLAAARVAGNSARNGVWPAGVLNITGRGEGVSVAVTDRMAAWRRERRVSRAARRLEQAERERAWALASAREGASIGTRRPRQGAQLHRRARHAGPAPGICGRTPDHPPRA